VEDDGRLVSAPCCDCDDSSLLCWHMWRRTVACSTTFSSADCHALLLLLLFAPVTSSDAESCCDLDAASAVDRMAVACDASEGISQGISEGISEADNGLVAAADCSANLRWPRATLYEADESPTAQSHRPVKLMSILQVVVGLNAACMQAD